MSEKNLTLALKIIPGSSCNEVMGWLAERLKIKVQAPAESGKANTAVLKLLIDRIGLDATQIRLISGHSNPLKVVEISGISQEQLMRALPPQHQ